MIDSYIFLILIFVIDESFNDAGFAGVGVSQEDDFESPLADGRTCNGHARNS